MRRYRLINDATVSSKIETISMTDFRSMPGEIMQAVQLGKRFIIEKNGKPIAQLWPYEADAFQLGATCRNLTPRPPTAQSPTSTQEEQP